MTNEGSTGTAELDGQARALHMLDRAKNALQGMKSQLAEAKEVLTAIVAEQGGSVANKDDVQKAKENFQSGLKVHVIDDPDAPGAKALMLRMYKLYEETFPIAEEREEYDKLLSLLGKNSDKKLQSSGALFREQWIVVEDPVTGTIVGARNTITFSAAREKGVGKAVDGTQHLIYGFVDSRFRSLGLGDYTMQIAENEARKFIASTFDKKRSPGSIDMIQISEQNAPLNMSMESILVDTAGAKTDQFWRREYYESLGFRELDFYYIQLPLEPRDEGGESTDELNLIIRGVPAPEGGRGLDKVMSRVSSDAVRFHLYNFFDRSVAAGAYDVEADIDWIKQAGQLKGELAVKPKLDFNAVKERTWLFMEKFIGGKRFDEDKFTNSAVGEMMDIAEIPLQKAAPAAKPAAPAAKVA